MDSGHISDSGRHHSTYSHTLLFRRIDRSPIYEFDEWHHAPYGVCIHHLRDTPRNFDSSFFYRE